jgi:SpoVK/Ycf46/Vps4 family AAA+-type ATPase
MTQENNNSTNLKTVIIPFHEFIANELGNNCIKPNDEILTVLLKREEWEGHDDGGETPTELSDRVKNWQPYDARKDRQQLTRVEQIQYQLKYGVKSLQLILGQAFYRISLVNAIMHRQYEQGVKVTSRGRATNILGVVKWNATYWPQYLKYYGFSGILNYCRAVLDYRRVFQLSVFTIAMGAGIMRFGLAQKLTKTQPTYVISAEKFSVQPKSKSEQNLLMAKVFGKKLPKALENPIVLYVEPLGLTNIQLRDEGTKEITNYPFIGLTPETLTTHRSARPMVPTYEGLEKFDADYLKAIRAASYLIDQETLKNVIDTGTVSENSIHSPNFFEKVDLNFFEYEEFDEKTDNNQSSVQELSQFFNPKMIRTLSTEGISIGTQPDWKMAGPKLQTNTLAVNDIYPLIDKYWLESKANQIHKTSADFQLENSVGKLTSAAYKTESEFDFNDLEDFDGLEVDEWDDFYFDRKSFRAKTADRENEKFNEFLMQTSMDELGLSKNGFPSLELKRINENLTKEQFKDLELIGGLLPSIFTWYAFYTLYQFRLNYIYNVRKKPEPILYTRLDHFGRLQNKVKLNEVVGIDGGGEAFDKLFSALQRARGMGLYLPTVLLTIWESSLSPLIPGELDNWLLTQRNKVRMNFIKHTTSKVDFLMPEVTLAQKMLSDPDKTSGYESRFHFLTNAVDTAINKMDAFEKSNSKMLSNLELTLQESKTKMSNIRHLQGLLPIMKVKELFKVTLKLLQLIENELSHSPVISALKPGRYGLNTLPKGMLLVGDPGNGRSFLARAIASESRLPVFKTESTRFLDVKFGVMRLMSLFRRVRDQAPGILFIRDIDLITIDRERTNSPELIQLTTQFLICFDGYYIGSEARPTQRKIFTLGSVSDITRMDPACLRSGRFEWVVNLRKPILGERKFLLLQKASQSPVQIDATIAWNYFGLMSEGFTNAEVVSIVNNSTLQAIRKNEFVHTNESLNEGLNSIFQLRWNQTVSKAADEGFFNELHLSEVINSNKLTVDYTMNEKERPFKTKCMHLLTTVKNWSPKNNPTEVSSLRMQNIGMSIQTHPVDYSQELIVELLDFMAEGAFIRQLRRCSPTNTFITQTSYSGQLGERLNKTFLKGCLNYRMENTLALIENPAQGLKTLSGTMSWEALNKTALKDLQQRTALLTSWYKSRMFCQLKPDQRSLTNRYGYNPNYQQTGSSSMNRFKDRIKARLRESTHQAHPLYAMSGSIRGTFGSRGYETRLQRPLTGPVTQMSQEFLNIQFK